jgi:hypothetical protein
VFTPVLLGDGDEVEVDSVTLGVVDVDDGSGL